MMADHAMIISRRAEQRGNAFILFGRGRSGTSRVRGLFYLARTEWLP